MIQLKDLSTGLSYILNSESELLVGGGLDSFNMPTPPSPPTNYTNSYIIPKFPSSSSSLNQAVNNVGLTVGDGRGNIFEVQRGGIGYENRDLGFGAKWNSDSVGGYATLKF